VRRDGDLGAVLPDGSGGVWWLESPGATRVTLVHGRPGVSEERSAAVPRPAPGEGSLPKGVAPSRLALPDATVGLDPAGRVVVVSGGVALGVDDGGTVAVLGQDARLQALSAVEGGLAAAADSTRLRVDLPR